MVCILQLGRDRSSVYEPSKRPHTLYRIVYRSCFAVIVPQEERGEIKKFVPKGDPKAM